MAFGEDLRLFAAKVEGRARQVFVGSVTAIHGSVVDGSPVTGAPGQPVDTGNLRASWQQTYPEDWVGEVSTNVVYAPFIEEGDYQLQSQVGGPHSVALTRSSWDRIVENETRIATGG